MSCYIIIDVVKVGVMGGDVECVEESGWWEGGEMGVVLVAREVIR